ncbi:MAG: helix-turn-helix transcriptional regulator, partial [Elusimicrobia bacterium]|nr:helix-turn-helix transcriptional regulator [Elusimicrobiota bacterium]
LSFKIFKLLKTKKITQKELSERTGIKQSSLSRILSDKYKTKTETLQKISKALNVPISSLLADNADEEVNKENILKES